jgi:hypothetical protein
VKRRLMVISLMAGAMFFSGCLGLNSGLAVRGSGGPGVSGGSGGQCNFFNGRVEWNSGSGSDGIDYTTQGLRDADASSAATEEQSNQDVRDAAAQASAASANQ